jgi:hypothetical protein
MSEHTRLEGHSDFSKQLVGYSPAVCTVLIMTTECNQNHDQVLFELVLSSSTLLAKPRSDMKQGAPNKNHVRINFFNIRLNIIDINRLAGVWQRSSDDLVYTWLA